MYGKPQGRENSILEGTASSLALLEHKTQRGREVNGMMPGVVVRWQMASIDIIYTEKFLKNFK